MSYPGFAPRRRRWGLFVPFALVVALAAVWTGLWYYAVGMADATIAEWREREARAGRIFSCERQTIGGYPFHIEVRCTQPTAELRGEGPAIALKARDALFVWQVYQPTLLIGEFSGPLTVSAPGGPSYVANWRLGRTSVRGTPSAPERVSVVIDDPTAERVAESGRTTVFTASQVELHGRMAAGSAADQPVIEAVLRLNSASAPELHRLTVQPLDADIAATLRGLADFSPKPWAARFRELQTRGGSIDITKARVQQGEVIAVGGGTLRLTPSGHLDGQVQLTIVGLDKVLKVLDIDRIVSEGDIGASLNALDRLIPGLGGIARKNAAPGIVAGLGALGQGTTLEGKPAVTVPLRFADGTVFLGPLPIGQIPPLF